MKFFSKAHLFIALIFITFGFCVTNYSRTGAPQDLLQITDADVALFESMGMSKADLEEAASFINNMTPEEQNALIEEGKKVEQKLQKLSQSGQLENITSQNDLLALLEESSEEEDNEPVMPKQVIEHKPVIPAPTEPVAKNLAIKVEPTVLLNQILEHVGSLQQKASYKQNMSHRLSRFQLELQELIFLLHLLNKRELIAYLTSKDFSKLYSTLEQLHSQLIANEPKIMIDTHFENEEIDNPYEILGLSPKATSEEISDTYDKLKQKYDPELIKKGLEKEGISEKDRSRKLKEAVLLFDDIESAYESLKNPKEKAQIDRELHEQIASQKRAKESSKHAFDRIINAISSAIYDQRVIQDIQSLFQKHAPEEKKKADAWEKEQKEAFELSKKREIEQGTLAKAAQAQSQQGLRAATRQKDVYQEFWNKYKVPEPKPVPPMPQPQKEAPKAPTPTPAGKKEEAKKPEGGKKPEAKKGEEKGKAEEKGKEKGKEAEKASAAKPGPIKVDIADIGTVALLHDADLEKMQKSLKEAANKEGSAKNLFANQLPAYLNAPKPMIKRSRYENLSEDELAALQPEQAEALYNEFLNAQKETEKPEYKNEQKLLDEIGKFVDVLKLPEITQDFIKFGAQLADPKVSKEKKENYRHYWQTIYDKYKDTIEGLWKLANHTLNPQQAPVFTKSIHQTQEAFHGLSADDQAAIEKEIKEKKVIKPGDKNYLGYIRYTIDSLYKTFSEISKKLGMQASKPAAVKK